MTPVGDPTAAAEQSDDRWRLVDERDFLVRSLEDAASEHQAGDLSDRDFEILRRRDQARLVAVEERLSQLDAGASGSAPEGGLADGAPTTVPGTTEEIPGEPVTVEAGEAEPTDAEPTEAQPTEAQPTEAQPTGAGGDGAVTAEPTEAAVARAGVVGARVAEGVVHSSSEQPAAASGTSGDRSPAAGKPARRRRRRRWLAAVGVVSLVAGSVVLVLHLAAPRLLGETGDGTIKLDPAETVRRQLLQAQALVNGGSVQEGLTIYLKVLQEDPRQPVALAEAGYLEWEFAGTSRARTAGRALVEKSLAVKPAGNYAAHLFLGVIELVQDGDAAAATGQFTRFLQEDPPSALVQTASATIRKAFTQAGEPVPSQVAG